MHKLNSPTVIVDSVTRTYRSDNRRSLLGPWFGKKAGARHVTALNAVSLAANAGECVGVLGRNGSGKSTLMRLIAGNESPDFGRVLVSATPTLLNVSAALQPKLTGRANIRLGLLAQGVARDQLERLSVEIQEFAEIGEAIDRPMATYSSGMGARLKFAISTAVRREILLVDEALGTGDAGFTEKAQERMSGFLDDAGTIFFVSHSMQSIKSICSRSIWLHEGRVIADGPTETVGTLYNKWMARTARKNFDIADSLLRGVEESYSAPKFHYQ